MKLLIVLFSAALWLGIEVLICTEVFHLELPAKALEIPFIFLNALQLLPKIGDFLGLLVTGIGSKNIIPNTYDVSFLFEIIYSLLLTVIFSFRNRLFHLLDQKIGTSALTESRLFDALGMLIIIISSVTSANLFGMSITKYLTNNTYYVITVLILLGLCFFIFFHAKSKRWLNAIGTLLLSLLSVALIYLMVMSGYCLSFSDLFSEQTILHILCIQ